MIQGLHITSNGILSCSYILQNIICSNVFRVNNTSDVLTVNNIVIGKSVYLGNQLGIRNSLCEKGKENILLVHIGQSYKGLSTFQPLFQKKGTVCAVTINNRSICKFFA